MYLLVWVILILNHVNPGTESHRPVERFDIPNRLLPQASTPNEFSLDAIRGTLPSVARIDSVQHRCPRILRQHLQGA